MKTLKLIKQLFLLCLIMAGTQSAWATASGYTLEKEATIGNLTFDLYRYHPNYGNTIKPFAVLKGISGTAEECRPRHHQRRLRKIFSELC